MENYHHGNLLHINYTGNVNRQLKVLIRNLQFSQVDYNIKMLQLAANNVPIKYLVYQAIRNILTSRNITSRM